MWGRLVSPPAPSPHGSHHLQTAWPRASSWAANHVPFVSCCLKTHLFCVEQLGKGLGKAGKALGKALGKAPPMVSSIEYCMLRSEIWKRRQTALHKDGQELTVRFLTRGVSNRYGTYNTWIGRPLFHTNGVHIGVIIPGHAAHLLYCMGKYLYKQKQPENVVYHFRYYCKAPKWPCRAPCKALGVVCFTHAIPYQKTGLQADDDRLGPGTPLLSARCLKTTRKPRYLRGLYSS